MTTSRTRIDTGRRADGANLAHKKNYDDGTQTTLKTTKTAAGLGSRGMQEMYPVLYVTHVQNFGPFLKISGHLNRDQIVIVEQLLQQLHFALLKHPVVPSLSPQQIDPTEVYAVQSSANGYFRRCKVLCNGGGGGVDVGDGSAIKVSLIDYGNEFEVPITQVRFRFVSIRRVTCN